MSASGTVILECSMITTAMILCLAAPICQEVTPPTPTDSAVTLRGGAWLPRLGGTIESGPAGSGTGLDYATDLDLGGIVPTANFELEIDINPWRIDLWGFQTSEAGGTTSMSGFTFDTLTVAPGAAIDTTFKASSLGISVSREFFRPYHSDANAPGGDASSPSLVDLSFYATVGMRWFDLSQSVESDGSMATVDGQWLSAMIGGGFTLDLQTRGRWPMLDAISIDVHGEGGPAVGGTGGSTWQIASTLTLTVSESIDLFFGYRLLETSLEQRDTTLNPGQQGLFVGGSIQF
jgi:hypothetical protein